MVGAEFTEATQCDVWCVLLELEHGAQPRRHVHLRDWRSRQVPRLLAMSPGDILGGVSGRGEVRAVLLSAGVPQAVGK